MQLEVRTLSEIKGEESLLVVGDVMAPLVEIGTDDAIQKAFRAKGGNVAKALKIAIKKHSAAIYDMLAALSIDKDTGEHVTREQYIENCDPITIMYQLTKVLNDPPVMQLFLSQGETMQKASTGSVTENTKA